MCQRRHLHREKLRGPPPVVILLQTFSTAQLPDYDSSMELLHSFIVSTCKPDQEEEGLTPSMPNVKTLPNGVDLISGKWRELRLNFSMGLNLKLSRHTVRSPFAQVLCTLLATRHVEPHTNPRTGKL